MHSIWGREGVLRLHVLKNNGNHCYVACEKFMLHSFRHCTEIADCHMANACYMVMHERV